MERCSYFAVENRVDLLVTGDKKHFGSFYGQILEGVTVVNLLEAIALLINQEKL
ncbi:hypothetical protein BJP36_07365 [Moorena producens JHB]|uniref:PIN domain-containing protein n=1 Tax=Moorena producens (strain JHB) TaxID=1454205 RepID=A0A1D9FWK5_MOOP1|nr:hypothetical protein [Moorena producens]AOY79768.2 hypothetical protein BJP36_07365 [Moorena producens JHB]